jgi:hypothetical protein
MRLAPVPPRSSVLPPGAGNEEAEKAVKTGKERAKKTEERYVVETGAVQRNLDTPTVASDRDGDVTAIPAIEQTQRGLHKHPTQPTRAVRAVYESMNDRATTRTAPFNARPSRALVEDRVRPAARPGGVWSHSRM